jgi:hypothetical protein
MPRTPFYPRAILSVAALTAALLGTACSDSTGPSKEEGPAVASPTTEVPGGGTTVPADIVRQLAELGHPSEISRRAPGDTTAAPTGINAYVTSMPWADRRYSPAPGLVRVPRAVTQCLDFGIGRLIDVAGIDAFSTGGNALVFDRYVTAEVWIYRYNGTSWVYHKGTQVGADLTSVVRIPEVAIAVKSGSYHVKVRFTWWANVNGWVKTAGIIYAFDRREEYAGDITGPGYCTMN